MPDSESPGQAAKRARLAQAADSAKKKPAPVDTTGLKTDISVLRKQRKNTIYDRDRAELDSMKLTSDSRDMTGDSKEIYERHARTAGKRRGEDETKVSSLSADIGEKFARLKKMRAGEK